MRENKRDIELEADVHKREQEIPRAGDEMRRKADEKWLAVGPDERKQEDKEAIEEQRRPEGESRETDRDSKDPHRALSCMYLLMVAVLAPVMAFILVRASQGGYRLAFWDIAAALAAVFFVPVAVILVMGFLLTVVQLIGKRWG